MSYSGSFSSSSSTSSSSFFSESVEASGSVGVTSSDLSYSAGGGSSVTSWASNPDAIDNPNRTMANIFFILFFKTI